MISPVHFTVGRSLERKPRESELTGTGPFVDSQRVKYCNFRRPRSEGLGPTFGFAVAPESRGHQGVGRANDAAATFPRIRTEGRAVLRLEPRRRVIG